MEEVPPDAAPGPEAPVEEGMEAASPVAAPAPAGAMFQTFVQSPPTRKKSVTVRRARDQPKPKKQVLVARRPHRGDTLDDILAAPDRAASDWRARPTTMRGRREVLWERERGSSRRAGGQTKSRSEEQEQVPLLCVVVWCRSWGRPVSHISAVAWRLWASSHVPFRLRDRKSVV